MAKDTLGRRLLDNRAADETVARSIDDVTAYVNAQIMELGGRLPAAQPLPTSSSISEVNLKLLETEADIILNNL